MASKKNGNASTSNWRPPAGYSERDPASYESWDPTEGPIEGTLERIEQIEFRGEKRTIARLTTDSGTVTVWCNVILDRKLSGLEGQQVWIALGEKLETKRGRQVQNYQVYTKDPF